MATVTVNKSSAHAAARRRFKLWMMYIVLFMGWAAYTFFGQMQEQDATYLKLSKIEEQVETSTAESEALKHQIERLNDPEYIAQLATKEQGMVKQGEQQIFSDK